MNVDKFLDIEKRTGIANDDIDDFIRKADEVDAAIKGLRDGTIDPTKEIKIAGIESVEEKAEKERQRQLRLEEQRKKAEELRLKRKAEEKERWWAGADLFATRPKEDDSIQADGTETAVLEKERVLQRYTMDYSRWNDWTPTDEVSVQEQKDLDDAIEKKKNDEFEKNNADFCNQFMEDMNDRTKRQEKKRNDAEACRNKGNRYFKRKEWEQALHQYMESLKILPYEVKTLMNIGQVYIKQKEHGDAEEFLSRVLYLDPSHVKGLSRKAFILSERWDLDGAMDALDMALKTTSGATNEDLIAQMEDLRLLQREQQQEEALNRVLPEPPEKVSTSPAAPTGSSDTSPPPAPPSTTATTKPSTALTDFEAASQVNVVINEVLAQLNSAKDGTGAVENFLDSTQHVQSLVDLMKRMGKNELLKVHIRKSGMLQTAVETSTCFCELLLESGEEAKEKEAEARSSFVAALLQVVAAAIEGERSAKLLLVDPLSEGASANNALPLLRDLLCKVTTPDLVYAATRVMLVCCQDNSSAKARSWVFNDKKLIANLATAIGELTSRNFTADPAMGLGLDDSSAANAATRATTSAFLITASDLIKTISFSANGQEHLTKFAEASDGTASGAMLICALSSALHSSILNTLAVNLQSLLGSAGEPEALKEVMKRMQDGQGLGLGANNAAVSLAEETCIVVMEALLGCSQVEPFRSHFCMDVPVAVPGAGAGAESTTQSCVHIILQAMKAVPGFTTTGLAVLMNASLDSSGAVRKAIVAAKGVNEALEGLKAASPEGIKALVKDDPSTTLTSRRLGLLSRIAPVSEVQATLYTATHYRSLLQALRACSGVDNEGGVGQPELMGHLVRTVASLNQPPKALLKVAQEERLAQAILHTFPEPRRELGKVTPESIILNPKEPASALLLGNAARCLMPLGDDLEGCALPLYTDRSLLGVEKLVCAMATCSDMRVRRNISILLAKGCRVKGVRELVTDFRGMQMMVELNKQL